MTRGLLAGETAWIISDGKAGHEAQGLGVVAALGMMPEIKRIPDGGLSRHLAPWGPVSRKTRFGTAGSDFCPPWPALAIAAGRLTVPYLRTLHRRAGLATFTVVMMNPRTSANVADLIALPEHDGRHGPNVIAPISTAHAFTRERLDALRAATPPEIAALPSPRVGVFIGGPNTHYAYSHGDVARLVDALLGVVERGASLMITPSRRTPPALFKAVLDATVMADRVVYAGDGDNPYPQFLAHADRFIITADSVNMTSEAAATGKPILVFEPSGAAAKFTRFHANLATWGATRPLNPSTLGEDWTYEPLDAARLIADEIERRILARRRYLSP